jgi:hypothetical protein
MKIQAVLRGEPAGQLPGALKHHWNKSEIYCTVEMSNKYLKNIGLKGRQIVSLPGAPTYRDMFGPVDNSRGVNPVYISVSLMS